jgi:hypothetical protein
MQLQKLESPAVLGPMLLLELPAPVCCCLLAAALLLLLLANTQLANRSRP